MSEGWEKTLEKLCEKSREDAHPEAIEWPAEIDPDSWCMAPELISLHGTARYEALDEAGRKRLAFREAVNFFSLNIHGEKSLVAGLAQRLYRKGSRPGHDAYLHHFLEEENRHMGYFGGFCSRYGGGVYPDKKMAFASEGAPGEEDFLFFAKVLVFEEIVDVYNVRCARDERLHPLVRRIHSLHHRDEARHLAFGRQVVRDLFAQHAAGWGSEGTARIRRYLADYLESTWKEYYNPQVYVDAGLEGNPMDMRREAFAASAARRGEISKNLCGFLKKHGIWETEAA
jgi:hypothetical protein